MKYLHHSTFLRIKIIFFVKCFFNLGLTSHVISSECGDNYMSKPLPYQVNYYLKYSINLLRSGINDLNEFFL